MIQEPIVLDRPPARPPRYSEMTPRHVVVVAAHPGVRRVLAGLLRSGGYLVVQASEPQEMCEEIGRSLVRHRTTGAVDFVLLDTRDSSGHACLDLLAELPREARRAIFAIVDERDDLAIERALVMGASIIEAPYDPDVLLDSILDIAPPFEIGLHADPQPE